MDVSVAVLADHHTFFHFQQDCGFGVSSGQHAADVHVLILSFSMVEIEAVGPVLLFANLASAKFLVGIDPAFFFLDPLDPPRFVLLFSDRDWETKG